MFTQYWMRLCMHHRQGIKGPGILSFSEMKRLKNAGPNRIPNARFAAECPVVILVCGDTSRETHKGYWPVDCAAAVQNMLLEATARGLGSLWLGVYPRQERIDYLSQNLQLPKHIVPFALVCFGYAADHPSKRGFYDPALVSFERWNKQTIQ